MTIGLEARGHNSGGISALLESNREEKASELEELRGEKNTNDKAIQSNGENQNQTIITHDLKKQKFKRNSPHHDHTRQERNITNSGDNAAFKLNNNLWKCEFEI